MTQEREALRAEFEAWLREKGVSNDELWLAMLDVGRDRIWRAGLWTRIKFWVNVVGAVGVLAGAAAFAASLVGYEVVKK